MNSPPDYTAAELAELARVFGFRIGATIGEFEAATTEQQRTWIKQFLDSFALLEYNINLIDENDPEHVRRQRHADKPDTDENS